MQSLNYLSGQISGARISEHSQPILGALDAYEVYGEERENLHSKEKRGISTPHWNDGTANDGMQPSGFGCEVLSGETWATPTQQHGGDAWTSDPLSRSYPSSASRRGALLASGYRGASVTSGPITRI